MLEAVLSFDSEFWRASQFRSAARVRNMEFNAFDTCCDGAPIGERVDEGTLLDRFGDPIGLPPGFSGYTIYGQGIRMILDTREERPQSGGGVRFGLDGEYAFDLNDPLARRWVRYGAAAGAFVDLTGSDRVLYLGGVAGMITPIEGEVPFTELWDLGDVGPMKGFIQGWLIGESAAAVTLEYSWPVWVWLDATLHLSFGNAFDRYFEDFELDEGRFSTGIGVRTIDERDHGFIMLLGFGSETIDDGTQFETVRLVVGGTRVF
jgi:hypothetical protein